MLRRAPPPHGTSLVLLVLCLLAGPGTTLRAAEAAEEAWETGDESLAATYQGSDITDFEVTGIEGKIRSRLASSLALSGRRKRLFWRERPPFSGDLLRADLERARLFLARSGYPLARVTPLLDLSAGERSLRVRFSVDPGPRVRVAANEIEAIPPSLRPRAEKMLDFEPGEVFTDERVEKQAGDLIRILKEAGHARAEVATRIERVDSTTVRVRFVVDAGPIYRFGRTEVRGVDENLVGVARRTIGIEPGTRYSPAPIERAAEGLRLLDLFRKVRVTTDTTRAEGRGDSLDVVAELAEGNHRSVALGLGYWTEDQVRFTAEWKHRNLLEKGRGAGVELEYSRFMQSGGLSFWKPTLFASRTRGNLALRLRNEEEANYDLLSGEVEASALYLHSVRTTVRPAVTVSVLDLSGVRSPEDLVEPERLVTAFSIRWSRQTPEDKLNPRRGTDSRVLLDWGLPGDLSGSHYLRGEEETIAYLPLADEVVLASRLGLGLGSPLAGTEELLPNKRFYAGGASSMRGFRRRMLGPLDAEGRPLGGEAKLEASVELRFPIIGRLGGAVFVDAGQVWRDWRAIRPADVALAAGPGLSVNTPVGPIRGDLGARLTDVEPVQPRLVFHLSVGHVF